MQFDLSVKLTVLKKISIQNDRRYEYLCSQITEPEEIENIENINGGKWLVQDIDSSSEYIVLRQIDEQHNFRYTGYYKIVKMTNAVVKQWHTTRVYAEMEHWMYYKERS